jgi:hypothetical protein
MKPKNIRERKGMKMNESKDNGGIKEFEKSLQPFIKARDEAEKALVLSRDRLKDLEKQKETLQLNLNVAVRESSESAVGGKTGTGVEDGVFQAKQKLDTCGLLIDDFVKNIIPQKEAGLKQADEQLASNLKMLIEPLRAGFQGKIDTKLSEVEALANEYAAYLDILLPRLNLRFDYWVKEGLYRLKPPSEKNMQIYNRLLSL